MGWEDLQNPLTAESEVSRQLISKPANGHKSEPVPSICQPYNLQKNLSMSKASEEIYLPEFKIEEINNTNAFYLK
jgi:hypothetical protein